MARGREAASSGRSAEKVKLGRAGSVICNMKTQGSFEGVDGCVSVLGRL